MMSQSLTDTFLLDADEEFRLVLRLRDLGEGDESLEVETHSLDLEGSDTIGDTFLVNVLGIFC